MTNEEFMVSVLRTEGAPTYLDQVDTKLLHGAMGVVTEAGEFMDALKKTIFYGKPVDRVNLVEEVGDMMWYIFLILKSLDTTLETVMDINSAKLRARYPEQFTQMQAVERDLDTERFVLMQGIGHVVSEFDNREEY